MWWAPSTKWKEICKLRLRSSWIWTVKNSNLKGKVKPKVTVLEVTDQGQLLNSKSPQVISQVIKDRCSRITGRSRLIGLSVLILRYIRIEIRCHSLKPKVSNNEKECSRREEVLIPRVTRCQSYHQQVKLVMQLKTAFNSRKTWW